MKKCPYCDFNSHAVNGIAPEKNYIDALLCDLENDLFRFELQRPIQSIFIGGGTPSLFSAASIDRLLRGIEHRTRLDGDVEITLEANPGTFESGKFDEFRALGINRLSIGIQSFDDDALKNLGRVHSAREAIAAIEIAHRAGFDNINLDLMYGLPGADAETSLDDIDTAIRQQPTHISFYQLTLEPNTYFHRFPPVLPDDGSIESIQRHCQNHLKEHGFNQYEVSAYSLADRQCRHNINYWQFGDYLGIGAGAHGKLSFDLPGKILRTTKSKHPDAYLRRPEVAVDKAIDLTDLPLEFVMNQLRLKQGFTLFDFQALTGLTGEALEPGLSVCLRQGLLLEDNQRYYCSTKGWNFLDSVLQHFMP